MSELVNARANDTNFRWRLLATVSAIALFGSAYAAGEVKAADDDSDRPTLWIELGGQLSRLDDSQDAFAPVFPNSPVRPSIFAPSQKFERPPLYSIDETGKLEFEPDGSDWVFSASILYGRSSGAKLVHQQTHLAPNMAHWTWHFTSSNVPVHTTQFPRAARFAETNAGNGESHSVIDFQAGKDVGLGMFGGVNGSSTINVGVRFAQFNSRSTIALKSDPNFYWRRHYLSFPQYGVTHIKLYEGSSFNSNAARLQAARSFHGIGPSISWNASASFAGNPKDGELALDWGVNAAVLFGRQRAKVQHQATGEYKPPGFGYTRYTTYDPGPVNITRSHTVTVPNVGGFAGLSFRYFNAKISAGYRADLFFGAMDGGIDTAHRENIGFYGPFASVSIGVGG